ncbi:MAG TPA: insulinase family protein [Nannocystaceae bacterium]|nr:insulinase family protein [Nannocystaceae bacterium]
MLALAACTKRVDSRPPGDLGAGPTPNGGDAGAHADETPKLGTDPDLETGKLANGMTYYIRHHEKPEKRVYLWLAVDAGSVLEDDDQKGLAHFVEHMAFNGTKRFEKNALIDFLEKSGVDFGADLNAFTSFDETVYQLKVPTDDPALVTKGLDILEDWSGALTFDPEEVQKERGVVVEEWRLGRGAGQRIFDKQWPIFLKGSKYADRKPIGEKEILEKAPVATLKRFYDDWYRPDLMAVVVVGDVDPKAMLKEIEKRWGPRKLPSKVREREKVPVPLLDETRAAVITDPEASMTTVSVAIKGEYRKLATEGDYRRQLVENLFQGMLRARLDEIRQKPDSPFVFAFSGTSSMGRAVDVFNLTAGVKGGAATDALKTLLTEVERVKQHGFVASELDRERARTLRSLERAVTEKDTVDGRSYAFDTVRRHLEKKAMPGRAAELELGKKFLPGITLDEVNALAGEWTKRQDRTLIASGPAREKMPGDADLLAVAKSVAGAKVAAYEDKGAGSKLMEKLPTPGTITKRETIAEIGVTVWTLSNGAKVVIKPTEFKKDEVLLEAFSPGGTSLVNAQKYKSARFADSIVQRSGVGEIDPVTLRNMMAGKVVNVTPWIGELEEGVRANASPKDLETMLQWVHLELTQPRKDPDAFVSWKTSTAEFVKNRDLNPQQVFFEKLQAFSWNNHPRRQPLTTEMLEEANHDAALDFYKERFADLGDFTFVFVGNVDEKTLEPMVAMYLASLPSKGRKEKWKDIGAKMPGGVKKLKVEKGQDPKSFVMLNFHGAAKWTGDNEDDIEILADVMEIRLREVLREDMSGVYGAFSRGSIARRPRQIYQYTVGFGCAPENAAKLQQAVFDIATSIKKDGVAQDYLDKVKEKRRRELETQKKENRFWMGQLSEHYRYGTDPKKILELEKTIERITSDNVKKTAKTFLKDGVRIEGLLVPEGGGTPAAATDSLKANEKPAEKRPADAKPDKPAEKKPAATKPALKPAG